MTTTQLKKIVLWVAKIATLVISAPATVDVVQDAYRDKPVHPIVLFFVLLAALMLVEGAFLYFWQQVEDQTNLRNREEREQNTYVMAAWSMYLLLLFIGILHGEGAVALILRFTMGLLLYVTTNDKLSAMRKKFDDERTKGTRKTRKERRKEAQAEEDISIALIDARKKQQIAAISAKADLLEQVSQEIITRRILLGLPAGTYIEGEVVEEEIVTTEEQTEEIIEETAQAVEQSDNKEDQTVQVLTLGEAVKEADRIATYLKEEIQQPAQEIKEIEVVVFDNAKYKVVKDDDNFVVSCYLCGYRDIKQGSASANAYTSAVRAGAKHMGKHQESPKQESPKS